MTKYEITLQVPGMGKVKHVIRATSLEQAKIRAQAADPKGTIVAFQEVKP